MIVYDKLKQYIPTNEQEHIDQQAMIAFIERNPDVLNRSNKVAHMTSSAIVLNEKMDKVLFAHHNIYNAWGWVGGHNDGDSDCLQVAIKEAKEETGVKYIYPYSEEILGIDIIHVTNHYKHGEYVSDHLHLNITYLLIANDEETLVISKNENSDVAWFPIDTVLDIVDEERMKPVYLKLFNQVEKIKKSRN
jgi:8-oxo-dGTP pyrophosphatase MutT (NUDIX family)